MKPQKMPTCLVNVPEALLRAAEEAEKRKNAALDRLEEKLAEHLPPPPPLDDFGRALEAMIDDDKAALQRGK